MNIKKISDSFSASPQIFVDQISDIKKAGFRSIICNRPDGEGADQPTFEEIKTEAKKHDIEVFYLPITGGKVSDEDSKKFKKALDELPSPTLAYCRSGTRSMTLWSISSADSLSPSDILQKAKDAGFDMSGVVRRIINGGKTPTDMADLEHDVLIIGAGAAGVSVASSMLKRKRDLDIAIIDPAEIHYYQPGWTLVGAGVFKAEKTVRTIASVIPKGTKWIKAAVAAFEPDNNSVILDGCRVVKYKYLVVCPGLKLNWNGIPGLVETLGKNGVTSNYRFDLAPYTWECVRKLKKGNAIFTQPPMPIKCAGAPQKALYLSADHWLKNGALKDINIQFHNAGNVLFGVKEYVPALMKYIEKYNAKLKFSQNLISVDGKNKKAVFNVTTEDCTKEEEVKFDMLHVVPPQIAPDFIRVSPLADANGWVDVDQNTLQHKKYQNIYSLGDVMNAPNAKTAAAARVQAPIVAENIMFDMGHSKNRSIYNGYGSCPLTVEKGKIVLAEFGYGGKILSSFPKWLLEGTKPSSLAWFLKETLLPPLYWHGMLKGHEIMLKPEKMPEVKY